jgi:CHAT domain-containing protein
MEAFYSQLANGEDKAAALRNAKWELLHTIPDSPPLLLLGCFVLVGEGSTPVPLKTD